MNNARRLSRFAIAGVLAAAVAVPATMATSSADVRHDASSPTDIAVRSDQAVYRIPDIAVTRRGTILLTYDRRNGSANDLPNDIDTMMVRSTDGGATWSAPRALVDYPGPQGCGDSSMIVERRTGRIFLFCNYSAGKVGFPTGQPGTNDTTDPNTLHLQIRHSDDDGLTWSAPTDLNPQVKALKWHAYFASSGHGIQTSTGRLIQPINVLAADGLTHSADIYSDDAGATWHAGALIAANTDESKAVELPDGTIMQNSRPSVGGYRFVSTSSDGGQTFGPVAAAPQLIDPHVNGDVIRVAPETKGPHRDWLLFLNPASQLARENLTLRLSCDGGTTWPIAKLINAGPSGYPAMAMVGKDRVGVFYENGTTSSYTKLTFATYRLSDLGAHC